MASDWEPSTGPVRTRGVALLLGVAVVLPSLGCATPRVAESPLLTALAAPPTAGPASGYAFFNTPARGDRWTFMIGRWQLRQRAAYRAGLIQPFPEPAAETAPVASGTAVSPASAAAATGGVLARSYEAFMDGRRREIARQVLAWVQSEAETRFVEDGLIDHWPTLPEVLASDGDDCDGLELLAYHALRDLGFPKDRVYRAVLKESRLARHHMVTLWFEDRNDPWVLDPTATITTRFVRLSEIGHWVPLKVFTETEEFTVRAR